MSFRNDQVSPRETEKILAVAAECLGVPGDFVEMGCYKGDTSLSLAEILREFNRGNQMGDLDGGEATENAEVGEVVEEPVEKSLWLFDSFEGLPEKTKEDLSVLGEDFRKGELLTPKVELKKRFLRAGIPVPKIKKAWFSELGPEDLPEKISFAFLDGDLYASILDSLRLVTPKISAGGVVIVHDYDNLALPGVRKAVEEWGAGWKNGCRDGCENEYGAKSQTGWKIRLERFESMAIIWF